MKSLTALKSFSKNLRSSFDGKGYAEKLNISGEGSVINDLYEKIDEGLTFPRDYQEFAIQGVVKARLYFDKRGQFIMKSSLFNSKNGFLRFHIMRYLETKLESYKLKTIHKGGFLDAKFVFRYQSNTLRQFYSLSESQFVFERFGFKGETKLSNAILEVGKTLVSILNLLKYRPDFLKTNKELQRQQGKFIRLEKIRKHPYYK
jgi:hypothetical protein